MCAEEDEALIFISIASYRDPQLAATVQSCLAAASRPERLRFGICWQHDETEAPPAPAHDARFRVEAVAWQSSGGACWARAEAMKLWQGEPWFLQLDSHCRMCPGWDSLLIRTAGATGSEKPVLSTYATAFTPASTEVLEQIPLQMALAGFTSEGIPHFRPVAVPAHRLHGRPLRARFLSAGFLFAPGQFIRDVPYDPELYFQGEEAALTLRAFTHGYHLFHPAEAVVWHDYVREGQRRHWDDHVEQRTARAWHERDAVSKARLVRLLRGEPLDDFNLGTARTLNDYEVYAGLSLQHGKAQGYTLRSEEPPNPPAECGWAELTLNWMVQLRVPVDALPAAAWQDIAFWYLGVFDVSGNEIYREDLTETAVLSASRTEAELVLSCEVPSDNPPTSWKIWPVSRTQGWLPAVEGAFAADDTASGRTP